MNLRKSSSKNELLYTSYNLPQLNHSSSRASLQSPQSKNNHSFNLYFTSSTLSPQNNKMVQMNSELFPIERKVTAFAKPRRSLLSASSYEAQTSTLAKSSSFGSLIGAQSTSSRSKFLPSIQFTHSNESQNSLMDVSLSPKKPTFNVSFQQLQSPKTSNKKVFSFGNELQATLGEGNVLKSLEKQNDTIAKLTQRIQNQERKERQRKNKPKMPFEDKEDVAVAVNTTSIKLDPIADEPAETAYTLKDVAIAVEELQKQDEEDTNNDSNNEPKPDFTNVKKRKSILKVSTRGQGSTLSDLIKLQFIRNERRDSSRSSRVTFADDEVKSEKDDFNEEPESPAKVLFVSKSVSDYSNLSSAEIVTVSGQNVGSKRFLTPRRSLFEPQSASSQESTRKNSDSFSETNSEDSSSSPKRERRSFRRVGRVTLPGRSKLGKILTTKVYQDEEGTMIQGKSIRQKLNGVLWAMVFPQLLTKSC